MQTYSYHGVTFQVTTFSGRRFIQLFPSKIIGFNRNHTVFGQDLEAVWDLERFKVARRPLRWCKVRFPTKKRDIRVLDMPIKMAGSNEYRLPEELLPFAHIIREMMSAEHAIMSSDALLKYHAYLTIDQGWVEPGETQRKEGCHVDGFQGARLKNKTVINHSWIATNTAPTEFFPQAFDFTGMDDAKHNFFHEMDRQAGAPETCEKNTIYGMDAYTVHCAGRATKRVYRSFIRLSYDVKVFDRLGNTKNPHFEYTWDMVVRDVQSTLV